MWAMPQSKTKTRPPLTREQLVERRAIEKDDAQQAWREYLAETESLRDRTERLRAARLARDAASAKAPYKKDAG
jgi:hypothetical protein